MITVSLVFIVAQVWLDLRMPEYMSSITTLVQTAGSEMSEKLIIWKLYDVLCCWKHGSSDDDRIFS